MRARTQKKKTPSIFCCVFMYKVWRSWRAFSHQVKVLPKKGLLDREIWIGGFDAGKILSCCLCKSNSQAAIVKHCVVDTHEDISKDPAQNNHSLWDYTTSNCKMINIITCDKNREKLRHGSSKYHRGPRGGGTSNAVKPLMHWAAAPSPTLRTYCHQN